MEEEKYELLDLTFGGGLKQAWAEVIVIRPSGKIVTERIESGIGLISVVYRVLDRAVGVPKLTSNAPFVESYDIQTFGGYGGNASLKVELRLRSGAVRKIGVGKDDCPVRASARAYLDALNKIV